MKAPSSLWGIGRKTDGVWSGNKWTLHVVCEARESSHALCSSPVQPPSDLWSGHSPPSHSSQDQFGNQQPVRRSQPKLTVWSESMKWILCFCTDNKRIPATNCKKHQDTDYTGVQHLSLNIKSRECKIIWEYFSNFRLGKVCFHRKANPEAVTNKISRFVFIKMGKPSMTPS